LLAGSFVEVARRATGAKLPARSPYELVLMLPRFFDTIESMHAFTMNLHKHDVLCPHCDQSGQFVSHGFIYKKSDLGSLAKIGKRIVCCKRFGKTGCGRTVQLYLCTIIPRLHYAANVLSKFIHGLLQLSSPVKSYIYATSCLNPRHAYRWVIRLNRRHIQYRQYSSTLDTPNPPSALPKRLTHLIPLLSKLSRSLGTQICSSFQLTHQRSFA
jgi:hypothetical protein